MGMFQATVPGMNILKIERIQNPVLFRGYMVKKQKIDKDVGGNGERQLFHGTDGTNITKINTQGFNRSYAGKHGECKVWLEMNETSLEFQFFYTKSRKSVFTLMETPF